MLSWTRRRPHCIGHLARIAAPPARTGSATRSPRCCVTARTGSFGAGIDSTSRYMTVTRRLHGCHTTDTRLTHDCHLTVWIRMSIVAGIDSRSSRVAYCGNRYLRIRTVTGAAIDSTSMTRSSRATSVRHEENRTQCRGSPWDHVLSWEISPAAASTSVTSVTVTPTREAHPAQRDCDRDPGRRGATQAVSSVGAALEGAPANTWRLHGGCIDGYMTVT